MEEVEVLGLLVQQAALSEEVLQRSPGQRRVRDRRRVVRAEVRLVPCEGTDRIVIPSPQVILRSA